MKIKAILLSAVIFLSFSAAVPVVSAAPGDPDLTFNGTGKTIFRYGLGIDQVFQVLDMPDGKTLVAAGSFFSDSQRGSLVKYNADGSLDTGFGVAGKFIWNDQRFIRFYSAAFTTDGKIIVLSNNFVGRVNADGTIDTTFGNGGIAALPAGTYYKVMIQPDGKILAGGVYESGRSFRLALARLSADGSQDQSFGLGGSAPLTNRDGSEIYYDFTTAQDGSIFVTGQSKHKQAPVYRTVIVKVTPGGFPDTNFGNSSRANFTLQAGSLTNKIVVQNDGKIVVGGMTSPTYPNDRRPFFLRVTPNGDLDTGFGGTGIVTAQSGQMVKLSDMFIQADGKLLAVGGKYDTDSVLLRFNANGSTDNTFGSRGVREVLGFYTDAAAVHSGGRIVLGGSDGDVDISLTSLNLSGELDAEFGDGGRTFTDVGEKYSYNAELLAQPDGKLVSIGGTSRGQVYLDPIGIGLARFNTDGTPDTSFAGDGNMAIRGIKCMQYNAVRVAAMQGDKFIVGCGDQFDHLLARVDANGKLDASFGVNGISKMNLGGDQPLKIAVLPGGKILSFTDHDTIYRFEADGALDNTFGIGGKVSPPLPTVRKSIQNLILLPGGKFMVCGYTTGPLPANSDLFLSRFNADGSLDTTFGNGGFNIVDSGVSANDSGAAWLLAADGKIFAAGDRQRTSQYNVIQIARFTADGQLDTAFGSGGFKLLHRDPSDINEYTRTHSAAMQADGKIVLYGGIAAIYAPMDVTVRLDADGNVDTGWGVQGWSEVALDIDASLGTASQSSMRIDQNGKIVTATSNAKFIQMRRFNTGESFSEMVKK